MAINQSYFTIVWPWVGPDPQDPWVDPDSTRRLADINNDAVDAQEITSQLCSGGNSGMDMIIDKDNIPKDSDKPDSDDVNADGMLKSGSESNKSELSSLSKRLKISDIVDTQTEGAESEGEELNEGEKRYWKKPTRWMYACMINGITKAGNYCHLCRDNGLPEKDTFFALAYYLHFKDVLNTHHVDFRTPKHYKMYLQLCKEHKIKPKAKAPKGWEENNGKYIRKQANISEFTIVKLAPPPPFTKAGLAEYVTEFLVDCDLYNNQTFGVQEDKGMTHSWHEQIGWFVGDDVTVNNVAIHYLCNQVDPKKLKYNPVEMRGSLFLMHIQICLLRRLLLASMSIQSWSVYSHSGRVYWRTQPLSWYILLLRLDSRICESGTMLLSIHLYFVCHDISDASFVVLDPGCKLTYLSVTWQDDSIKKSMKRMLEIFLKYKEQATRPMAPASHSSDNTITQALKSQGSTSTEDWMEEIIRQRAPMPDPTPESTTAELDEYMYSKPVNCALFTSR
ncbi:hypothetical protein EDD18DRAFT_1100697 [Armillaria luteobubalina]|uniref:Uncharacterized protein n=1 Tax=Armillaria luteobubalina TaxID=153913 RepID=A0AA39QFZ5_9AGAR|nr:hypothetical protein EDD18DRAFT_1100697 [Armillaria luteobubalina]